MAERHAKIDRVSIPETSRSPVLQRARLRVPKGSLGSPGVASLPSACAGWMTKASSASCHVAVSRSTPLTACQNSSSCAAASPNPRVRPDFQVSRRRRVRSSNASSISTTHHDRAAEDSVLAEIAPEHLRNADPPSIPGGAHPDCPGMVQNSVSQWPFHASSFASLPLRWARLSLRQLLCYSATSGDGLSTRLSNALRTDEVFRRHQFASRHDATVAPTENPCA